MFAPKLQTLPATLLVSFALSFAACSGDGGSSPGPTGTGGATLSGGSGGMNTQSGGSIATSGGSGGMVGSGGALGGSSSGGMMGGAGAATGGATGGSSGASSGGAAGSSGSSGTAGTSGQSSGGGGGMGGASSGGAGGKGGGAGGAGGAAAGNAGAGGNGGGNAGAGGGASYQPCPASGPCKIMPFGDSITQGFNVNGGYRAPLFHLALAGGRNITFVGSANDYSVPTVDGMTFPKNHEGHGGYTIEGNNGIAQFVSTSIPNYKPNIITLMIGTNDINGNVNVGDAPNRLGKLLDSIFSRDANVLVVLAQIVPTKTDGTNNTIKTYNAAMPNLVSTRVSQGRHIVLVDMYGAFTKDANYKNTLFGDNLHPNQAGYNLMADVWFQALDPYLPKAQ